MAEVSGDSVAYKKLTSHEATMPSVIGMGLRDAIYLLESQGLVVCALGTGKVSYQSINAGELIYKGNYVNIRLN